MSAGNYDYSGKSGTAPMSRLPGNDLAIVPIPERPRRWSELDNRFRTAVMVMGMVGALPVYVMVLAGWPIWATALTVVALACAGGAAGGILYRRLTRVGTDRA